MKRRQYRFAGRFNDTYFWESVLPIGPRESRHEEIRCSTYYFWQRSDLPVHTAPKPYQSLQYESEEK